MYRTILVPVDGSSLAERVLPYARFLMQATRAKMILLHVVETRPFADSEEIWDDMLAERGAEAYLTRLSTELDGSATVDTAVIIGDPAQEIVNAVKMRGVDLIAMSTHGRSGLGRLIQLSVTDEVMRHASVPILLISPHCDRGWSSDRPFRILVALDGSELAEKALGPAARLAETLGAELLLVRVVGQPPRVNIERTPNALPDVVPDDEAVEAELYLERVAAALRATHRSVRTMVERGDPGEAIPATASAEEADLIAIAGHGRNGVARLVLGSVATRVVQEAGVPVLMVGSAVLSSKDPAISREAAIR